MIANTARDTPTATAVEVLPVVEGASEMVLEGVA